ncbi:glycosyltransferase family 2 protein [Candidatus Woesearchaeota archaeon]|nr:glycosyltransferase family 2 protein [Candidatus Woesearchaeota archaeon]
MTRLKKTDCWIIVSAYNESRHIQDVIKRIREQGFSSIIVVDDASRDKTSELVKNAVLLQHIINCGKGAAMRTGATYALKQSAKAVIFIDGDGQHAPEELPRFLNELNSGASIVFGARRETRKMPIQRRLGKILVRNAVRILYKVRVHDVLSGYRALTAHALNKVMWTSSDYTVESEMIANAGRENVRYSEITISTIYHDKYKGVNFLHGFIILGKLLWWKVTR